MSGLTRTCLHKGTELAGPRTWLTFLHIGSLDVKQAVSWGPELQKQDPSLSSGPGSGSGLLGTGSGSGPGPTGSSVELPSPTILPLQGAGGAPRSAGGRGRCGNLLSSGTLSCWLGSRCPSPHRGGLWSCPEVLTLGVFCPPMQSRGEEAHLSLFIKRACELPG